MKRVARAAQTTHDQLKTGECPNTGGADEQTEHEEKKIGYISENIPLNHSLV